MEEEIILSQSEIAMILSQSPKLDFSVEQRMGSSASSENTSETSNDSEAEEQELLQK